MSTENVKYSIELVDEVSEKLKKINKNLNQNDKNFEKTGKKAEKFGESVDNVGKSLGKSIIKFASIGTAILATKKAFDFTTRSVFEFSGASAKLKAIVQPTIEQFNSLEKAALKLGSTTSFTASQVMDAFTEQAKLGQKVNEILASGNSILNLAATAQIGLSEAAEMTVQTLNQFDLSAKDTNRVVDVMAKSFTSSALDARKFAESMKYAGTIGSESGNSIEDVSAVLGILADRAIDASQAGTATRRVMLELANANSKASKAIAKTGKNATTFTEKLQVLKSLNLDLSDTTDLFGLLSATAATVMIKSADSIDSLSDSLQNANGSADQMAKTMLDSLPGAAIKMKSALEGLALTTKDVLTPALTTLMTKITGLASAWKWLLQGAKEQEKINSMTSETIDKMKNLTFELKAWEQAIKNGNEEFVKSPLSGRGRSFRTEKALIHIENLKNKIKELNGEFQKSSGSSSNSISTKSQKSTTEEISKTSISVSGAEKAIEQHKKMSQEILKIQQQTDIIKSNGRDKEFLALDQWYAAKQEKYRNHNEFLEAVQVEYDERKIELNTEFFLNDLQKEQEVIEQKKTWLDELAQKNKEVLDRRAKDEAIFKTQNISTTIDGAQIVSNALFTIGKNSSSRDKKRKIQDVKNSKKSEQEKAKAIEAIEKQEFEKNKKRSIFQAIINGALGATKTLANVGMPAAIPMLILQGVMTAANIAVIASQKFAKGGVVQQETGKSAFGDQHLIRANPGERVLTKEQNKNLGTTVNIGDTNIIIQGDISQESLDQIDKTLSDRNEEIRDTLLELSENGRIAGVTF